MLRTASSSSHPAQFSHLVSSMLVTRYGKAAPQFAQRGFVTPNGDWRLF
jgi:hypothetical protein